MDSVAVYNVDTKSVCGWLSKLIIKIPPYFFKKGILIVKKVEVFEENIILDDYNEDTRNESSLLN